MIEIKRSYCGLCHPRCGLLPHIEDGKVVKITGDPDHPINRGVLCERGRIRAVGNGMNKGAVVITAAWSDSPTWP